MKLHFHFRFSRMQHGVTTREGVRGFRFMVSHSNANHDSPIRRLQHLARAKLKATQRYWNHSSPKFHRNHLFLFSEVAVVVQKRRQLIHVHRRLCRHCGVLHHGPTPPLMFDPPFLSTVIVHTLRARQIIVPSLQKFARLPSTTLPAEATHLSNWLALKCVLSYENRDVRLHASLIIDSNAIAICPCVSSSSLVTQTILSPGVSTLCRWLAY